MASVTRTAVVALQGGVGYELAGIEEWAPETVQATFDGSAAVGSFLACVSIYSPGGALISRTFPDDAVTAGDVAEVTYAPFLRKRASTTPSGTGIDFDVDPQTGGWLTAHTTDATNPPEGFGIDLVDEGGWGVNLSTTAGGGVRIANAGAGSGVYPQIQIADTKGGIRLLETHAQDGFGRGTIETQANGDDGAILLTTPNGTTGTQGITLQSYAKATAPAGSGRIQLDSEGVVNIRIDRTGAGPVNVYGLVGGVSGLIFRIDQSGAIHGLAAVGGITWDL